MDAKFLAVVLVVVSAMFDYKSDVSKERERSDAIEKMFSMHTTAAKDEPTEEEEQEEKPVVFHKTGKHNPAVRIARR